VVAIVEGGYDLKALASCARAVGHTLLGMAPDAPPPTGDETRGIAAATGATREASRYWRL
jgi:acetoin utilization deacetylase AcuC-like enzyme